MMKAEERERFETCLRTQLSEQAGRLFDFRLELMEQEIAEGWRCMYAQAVLFRKLLPEPLINELGRQYELERLREEIWRPFNQLHSNYHSELLHDWRHHPEHRAGYRNYLDVGELEGFAGNPPDPYDRTACDILTRRIEQDTAHWKHETRANADDWFLDASFRCMLTPPFIGFPTEDDPPPDPAVRHDNPGQYWRAVHRSRYTLPFIAADYPAFTKPDWNLRLMAEMAPDFAYDPALSKTSRLVFVQQGESRLAWALLIDKTYGSPDYRYPPQLILLDRARRNKLKDEHVLFANPIKPRFYADAKALRSLETQLLFHLPRSRRLIAFFEPFVADALAICESVSNPGLACRSRHRQPPASP